MIRDFDAVTLNYDAAAYSTTTVVLSTAISDYGDVNTDEEVHKHAPNALTEHWRR